MALNPRQRNHITRLITNNTPVTVASAYDSLGKAGIVGETTQGQVGTWLRANAGQNKKFLKKQPGGKDVFSKNPAYKPGPPPEPEAPPNELWGEV